MTKHALVTGSSGLIGRHMRSRLLDMGWAVAAIDVNADDIHCRQDAREFFFHSDTRFFDLVVHCAAHVGGRQDIENRATFIGAMNLQLDGALFEWALRTRPAHIIYWSSSAVYPVAWQGKMAVSSLSEGDVDLNEPDLPDATYGWVKLTGERLAAEAEAEGLRVHVFRPFSGWAVDQDITYPMGAYLTRARQRMDPFVIWGDGEQVRDFIHVDDIISGALAAIEQDHQGPLNLCSGEGTSFNQLAELVCKTVGYSPVIEHRLEAPVGVQYRVGDPTKMLKVWEPHISLEAGVAHALGVS